MTQEDKQLLIIDLCTRLPYGVKIYTTLYGAITLNEIMIRNFKRGIEDTLTPYLRPMSSMTEEERKEHNLHRLSKWSTYSEYCANVIDWLNAHYFDYRGLIPKGLALEAPEDMYMEGQQ